jgi:hypothetical protein
MQDHPRPEYSLRGFPYSAALVAISALCGVASPAVAQTDYYNTDAGRPFRVEDAYPIERRAIEVTAAPLRLERLAPGWYGGELEPQIAVGIAPRTQLEVGAPVAFAEGMGSPLRARLTGVEVSVLHNLNVETTIPALAVEAAALLPVGSHSADRVVLAAKAIATRGVGRYRMHLNAGYTFGAENVIPDDHPEPALGPHLSRWMAGLAIDRAIPLRSLLLGLEVVAEQPMHAADPLEWTIGGGWRYQLTPRIAVDAGMGRRVTGGQPGWYVTSGSAMAVGIPWWPR